MKPGRELDRVILERVIGEKYDAEYERLYGLPYYSTDIAAAWEVVEKLEYNWSLVRDVGKCGAEFETRGEGYRFIYSAPGMPMEGTSGESAPHAICLAALKAVNASR